MSRILIADDNREYVQATELAFQAAGYVVTGVDDPERIMDVVRRFRPTVILMDLMWGRRAGDPNEEPLGRSLLEAIRNLPEFHNVPAVFNSVVADGLQFRRDADNTWIAPKDAAFESLLQFLQERHLI